MRAMARGTVRARVAAIADAAARAGRRLLPPAPLPPTSAPAAGQRWLGGRRTARSALDHQRYECRYRHRCCGARSASTLGALPLSWLRRAHAVAANSASGERHSAAAAPRFSSPSALKTALLAECRRGAAPAEGVRELLRASPSISSRLLAHDDETLRELTLRLGAPEVLSWLDAMQQRHASPAVREACAAAVRIYGASGGGASGGGVTRIRHALAANAVGDADESEDGIGVGGGGEAMRKHPRVVVATLRALADTLRAAATAARHRRSDARHRAAPDDRSDDHCHDEASDDGGARASEAHAAVVAAAAGVIDEYVARYTLDDLPATPAVASAITALTPHASRLPRNTVSTLYRWMEHVREALASDASASLNAVHYTALLRLRGRALGHGLRMADVNECLSYMRRHRVQPDTTLMNVLLDGLTIGRQRHASSRAADGDDDDNDGREVDELLRVMRDEWAVEADVVTVNTLLEHAVNERDIEHVLQLYDEWFCEHAPDGGGAHGAALAPDDYTYRALFRACDPREIRKRREHGGGGDCGSHRRGRPRRHDRAARDASPPPPPPSGHSSTQAPLWAAADAHLPHLHSVAVEGEEERGAPLTVVALNALTEAYAFAGKGAEVVALLERQLFRDAEQCRALAARAIRGLAYNVRARPLARYAFVVHRDYYAFEALSPDVTTAATTAVTMRSNRGRDARTLDALLTACDRVGEARRAIDLFYAYADRDAPTLPTFEGVRALIRAHGKASPALWPALAECLALASAAGVQLDASALALLARRYDEDARAGVAAGQARRLCEMARAAPHEVV